MMARQQGAAQEVLWRRGAALEALRRRLEQQGRGGAGGVNGGRRLLAGLDSRGHHGRGHGGKQVYHLIPTPPPPGESNSAIICGVGWRGGTGAGGRGSFPP